MKKILTVLAIMITVTTTAFAGEKIDQKVLDAFQKEFAGAKDATWQERNNFYEVTFEYNGERVFAFYNSKAELICVTRYILSTELPFYLQKSLKKNYADFWITDLFELSNEEGMSYYITLQNADNKIILESKDHSNWKLFREYQINNN